MTTLVLYVGIAVTFLTVWGVIMVGSYLIRGGAEETPAAIATDWVPESPLLAENTGQT